MKTKILYPARIEKDNLGDILINALLVRELSQHVDVYFKGMPPEELLWMSQYRNDFAANIHILDLDTKNTFRYKLSVLNYLVKHGNTIYCSFETPGHMSKRKNPIKSILKYSVDAMKILVYKCFDIKYGMLGVTLGPFRKHEWALAKFINRLSAFTIVRDSVNFKALKSRNFQVELVPDLAYLLHENSITDIPVEFASPSSSNIIVSLRGSIQGKSLHHDYLQEQVEKVRVILETQPAQQSVLVCYQVEADELPCYKVYKDLVKKYPNLDIRLEKQQLTFGQAVSLYRAADLIITNRLHVYLFGLCVGTSAIVTTDESSHKKLVNIIRDMDLSETLFNQYGKVSAEDIKQKFAVTAGKNRKVIKYTIEKICPQRTN